MTRQLHASARSVSLLALAAAMASWCAVPTASADPPAAPPPIPADVPMVADTSGTATTQPDPGQIIVRLNGRFRSYGGFFDDQDLNREVSSTTYSFTPATVTIGGKPVSVLEYKSSTAVSQNRQANYGLVELFRLYPGFDGMTPGGLKYGASIEIRDDNTSAPGGGDAGSVSGAEPYRGMLYVRREWGYLGTKDLGTLRFGTVDSASSLFLTGVLENYNDGGWNGDVRYGLASNAQLRWPFADDGSYYATNKLVYLSPSLAGFDFGVSFEPSSAGDNINDGNCSVANTSNTSGTTITVPSAVIADVGCDRLSSTTTASESARRRNTVDVVLRYRQAFDNGIGLAATAAYIGGGHVAYTGPDFTGATGKVTNVVTYRGLSMGDFGVAVTYAGLQLGGNYQYGTYNNAFASGSSQSFTPAPRGAKPASAFSMGASYTAGPAIIGATWVTSDSQGAFSYASGATPAASLPLAGLGSRREVGLNAGGTLKVAPGLGVIVSYLWDERKQTGYDWVTSDIVAGSAEAAENNKIHAQALTLGTSITW